MKALVLLAVALPIVIHAGDWPRFLGPTGAAQVRESKVPLTWSGTQNVAWKAALPGPGSSSPIVVGDNVLVTCWTGYGDKAGADDMRQLKRHLVCLNLRDGKKVWETVTPSTATEDAYQGFITEHGYATHTPVSDGERVYCFFGKSGAYAFDLKDGKQLWHTPLGTGSGGRRWGSGGSPILYEDTVIVNASDESRALYALDKKTGKEIWKAGGDLMEMAYATPSLMEAGGRTDLVFALAEEVWGMNPDTGKLRWYAVHQLPGNVSPSLVQDGDVAYLFGGFPTQGSVAVKLGGKDDATSNIVWSSRTSSYVPTPILHEGHLYVVNDQGFAICMNAKTGEDVYRERVIESGGGRGRGKPFYASPVLIGDRLYCVSRKGGTYVIAAKPVYQKLAHNVIETDESQFNATPAVTGDRMILRSDWGVYCVEGKQ
jgi:outer membrane protein assembly factor BamB